MGVQFDWQSDDGHESELGRSTPKKGWPWRAALAVLILVGGWVTYLLLTRPGAEELIPQVQLYWDSEHAAINTGDRDLFLSLQDRDAGWIAQQFAQIHRTGADLNPSREHLVDAEQHGLYVWVTLSAQGDGQTVERKTFYRWQDERLIHSAPDPDFWGRAVRFSHSWGTLTVSRRDADYATSIAAFVDATIATLCETRCLRHRVPIDLRLSDSLLSVTVPGAISLSSPQLIGVDQNGEPAPAFWEELERLLVAQLAPAEIRFAVPATYRMSFQILADEYMASISSTKISLVLLEELESDPAQLFSAVDGAFLAPDLEMATGGYIRDLSDFAGADDSFDVDDFYNAPKYGMRWNSRIWSVPHSMQMSVIYLDVMAYERAGMAPSTNRGWSWDDLWAQSATIQATTQQELLPWELVDVSGDAILSYALTTRCARAGKVPCTQRMQLEDVRAAFEWYRTQVEELKRMPNLMEVPEADRIHLNARFVSASRSTALWTSSPDFFEHYWSLDPVTVQVFPGLGGFPGVTPVHVMGGVISQDSAQAFAVWEWLKYLSYRRPLTGVRDIPARRSVARHIAYWTNLPDALQEPMRSAFETTRPLQLDERTVLTRERITAYLENETTLEDLEEELLKPRWFGR